MPLSPLTSALAFYGVPFTNPKTARWKNLVHGPIVARAAITSTLAAAAKVDFDTTGGERDVLATGATRYKGVITALAAMIPAGPAETPANIFEVLSRCSLRIFANGAIQNFALAEMTRIGGVVMSTETAVAYTGGCSSPGPKLVLPEPIMFGLGQDDVLSVRNDDNTALSLTANLDIALYVYGLFAKQDDAQDFIDSKPGSPGAPCELPDREEGAVSARLAMFSSIAK